MNCEHRPGLGKATSDKISLFIPHGKLSYDVREIKIINK